MPTRRPIRTFAVAALAACSPPAAHEPEPGTSVTTATSSRPGVSASPDGAPLPRLVQGYDHVCVLERTGTVRCWGSNLFAQLGPGFAPIEPKPVAIPGIDDAVDLAADGNHTCAVRRAGEVLCWGGKSYAFSLVGSNEGQSGSSSASAHAPAALAGITSARKVAVGWASVGLPVVCVLLADGTVRCSGPNHHGQVGDGTTEDRDAPVPVVGVTDAVDVATDGRLGCALRKDASVLCWGSYGDDDAVPGPRPRPVDVPPLVRLLRDSADCGIGTDGKVLCWGARDGEPAGRARTPKALASFGAVKRVAFGGDDACAVDAAGALRCQGKLDAGAFTKAQLGKPVDVSLGSVSCVAFDSGAVGCRGKNGLGQLGIGESHEIVSPAPIHGVDHVTELVVHDRSACALVAGGTVRCWGRVNGGMDDAIDASSAAPVPGLDGVVALMAVSGGYVQSPNLDTCVGKKDGSFVCFQAGRGKGNTAPVKIAGLESVAAVASGASSGPLQVAQYAIHQNGDVDAWVAVDGGEEGVHAWKEPIAALAGMSTIVVAEAACGVRKDGTVACWLPVDVTISDDGTALSAPPGLKSPALVAVPGLADVDGLAHGMAWCAHTKKGELHCWDLQVDGGKIAVSWGPNAQPDYAGVVSLAGSGGSPHFQHLCGVLGGEVVCDGTLEGMGSSTLGGMLQVNRRPFGRALLVRLTENGGCLVRPGGTVACFGTNDSQSKGLVTREASDEVVRVLLGP